MDEQHKVRLMAPFSMRCNTCGEWVYKGKKFNARKENAVGETYLSIQIYRYVAHTLWHWPADRPLALASFYIRCPRCSAEITFKTDPENSDYTCEHGAQRNFEPWRDQADAAEAAKLEREAAEENNPMKHLENRTEDTKREIDILDALDEMRSVRARQERVGIDSALSLQAEETRADLQAEFEEDEAEVQKYFGASKTSGGGGNGGDGNDDDDDDDEDQVLEEIDLFDLVSTVKAKPAVPSSSASSSASSSSKPVAVPILESPAPASSKPAAVPAPKSAAQVAEEAKKRKQASNPLGIVVKKKAT